MAGWQTCKHGVCFDCGYHGDEHHPFCDSSADYPKADEEPCAQCALEKKEKEKEAAVAKPALKLRKKKAVHPSARWLRITEAYTNADGHVVVKTTSYTMERGGTRKRAAAAKPAPKPRKKRAVRAH